MAAPQEKSWLTIREKVTLDWTLPTEGPKGKLPKEPSVKKLSPEQIIMAGVKEFTLCNAAISTYNVSVCNANSRPLAVFLSSSREMCLLLRPARFIIKGSKAQVLPTTFFTLALAPLIFHGDEAALEALFAQCHYLDLHTYLLPDRCQDFIDLDALFANGPPLPYKNECDYSLIRLPYILRRPPGDTMEKPITALERLFAPSLQFRYTCPGHLTAYFFLHLQAQSPPTAWRLSPVDSLWYTFQDGGLTTCGIAFPNQQTFTYVDFKGHHTDAFKEGEQTFRLEAVPMPGASQHLTPQQAQALPSYLVNQQITQNADKMSRTLLPHSFDFGPQDSSPFYKVKSPLKEYQFTFKGPYNRPQSATIRIENPSKGRTMLCLVIPQEISLFDFSPEYVRIPGNTSDDYTIKLKDLVATFKGKPAHPPVSQRMKFCRLDTFFYDEPESDEDFNQMLRSIDRRELRCTFIRCTFEDEDALKAAEKGEVYQMPDTGKPVIAESIGNKQTSSAVVTDSQMQENPQPGVSPIQPSALLSPSANQLSTSPPIGHFTESQDNHSPGGSSVNAAPGSAQIQQKTVGGRTKRSRSPEEKLSSPPNTSQLKAQQSTQQGRPKKRTPKSPGKARQLKGGSVQPQGNSVLPGSPHFRAYRQTVYQRRSPLGPGSPRAAHLRLTVPTKEDMEMLFGIVVCLAVSLLLQDAFIKTLT